MKKKVFDKFVEVCEAQGWTVRGERTDEYVTICNYSPAGEDISFDVEVDNFVNDVYSEYDNFDAEEHAAMWYGQNRGEPTSIRALLNDADAIDDMLQNLSNAIGLAAADMGVL